MKSLFFNPQGGGGSGKLSSALTSGNIFVGNASNIAAGVTPTGDVTINNAGVTAIKSSVALSGTPTAATATAGTSTTQIATTAFAATAAANAVANAALLNATQTFTAPQTFTNSDLKLLGSSTGVTTFTSANASATNYTLTTPAVTDTLAGITLQQNIQSAAYTTVLSDAGKEIYHPSSDNNARTFTIDSNANVAYPIGTLITFTNAAATASSIAITSDTLTLAGSTTTGTRTLAQNGTATAAKKTATTWIISGVGLT